MSPLADRARAIVERAETLRAELSASRLADELAFGAVVDAQKLPKGRKRNAPREPRACRPPSRTPLQRRCTRPNSRAAFSTSREKPATLGNEHLASDVECALEFARAALNAAALNVRANHPYFHDKALVDRNERTLAQLLA